LELVQARRKTLQGVMVVVGGQAELAEIVDAVRAARSLPGSLHRGQQQCDQNPDDSDYHE
jgi:hypothetical protein